MRKCLSLNLACCLLLGQLPVSAAVTPTDIQAALEKAKILFTGHGVVRFGGKKPSLCLNLQE